MSESTPKPLAANLRKTFELLRLLAGHEVLGLAPAEIAKALDVSPSWVSINLPAIEAETHFVERVAGTNRWRLGELQHALEALAWHRGNVEKHNQPELEF